MNAENQEPTPNQVQVLRRKARHTLSFLVSFSKKRPILSAAAAVVLLVVVVIAFRGGGSVTDTLSYHTVERGDFPVTVIEGGTLQAVNEVTVRNEVDGTSRIIYIVPEGTYVKKGDLIVELDTETAEKELNEQMIRYEDDKADFARSETDVIITRSTVESDIRKAELDVLFAKMDLEKFEQIEREQEIRNAQIEIITAQESLKLAEERLEWSKKLTDEGFETKSNLDRDALAVTNQSLGLEKAESVKRMLSEFDLEKMEAEYRSLLEEAEQELERVKKQGESKISQALTQLEIDRRQMELGAAKLAKMQEQMAATKMYAPQDGLIVYAMNNNRYSNESIIEEGATIRQRQSIVKIPDTSKMQVEIKVHESYVNQVEVGQKAFVVLDSLPDERFQGEVTRISVLPDAQSRWGNSSLKVYTTEILITDKLPDVKPGVSARAEIVVADLKNVIRVPIQCVTTVKGKQVCYVKSLGGPEPREVEIGLFNNKFIEIRKGLEAGERVLLSPPLDTNTDLGGGVIDEEEELDLSPSSQPESTESIQPDRQASRENRPRKEGERDSRAPRERPTDS